MVKIWDEKGEAIFALFYEENFQEYTLCCNAIFSRPYVP